ncbi:hypothetical protein [Pyruvatibacter mobilis]|uniref:hypothetical protein n=1 Tax=Pyruvatibacter mobilis TaxID=1712261 RepID=UPI003D11642A
MTPLAYSRTAFKALAALPPQEQAAVRKAADTLRLPGASVASMRALPGGLARDLAQVAVEGMGRLVCRIQPDRIDVLAIIRQDHALPPQATADSPAFLSPQTTPGRAHTNGSAPA